MILRIVSGRLRADGIEALRDVPDTVLQAPDPTRDARAPSEPIRSFLAVDPPGREVVAVTLWSDVAGARDALDAEQAGLARAAIPPSVASFGNPVHFDIESSWIERSPSPPAMLRIAVGRFTKPGAYLEMEEALRERLPTLGEDMIVACAGRRMVDRSVEVLFFSGWRREPEDLRLDEPVWTDISLRYDEFSVRVYVAPRVLAVRG